MTAKQTHRDASAGADLGARHMAIRHVVLFNWNDLMTDEIIAEIEVKLAGLPAAVGCISSYTYGPDLSLAEGNADYAVVADFETVEDWEQYRDNPIHQDLIRDLIRPNIASRSAVQFKLG